MDELLAGIERASEMALAQNAQMLDGHLRGSDQVIANVAALRTIHEGGVLLEVAARAAQNPT
jgi:hypothetical protein